MHNLCVAIKHPWGQLCCASSGQGSFKYESRDISQVELTTNGLLAGYGL